jgi:hypothetical protein
MPKRHGTRRSILGALVVLVAAASALGAGHGASATDDGPRPRPDYASKEAFRLECELLGGIFTESGGYTYCHHEHGTVRCEANGKACMNHPKSYPPRPGGGNSYDGSLDQVATDDGGTGVSAPAVDREPKAKTKRDKGQEGTKGKKHRHGGKGRK